MKRRDLLRWGCAHCAVFSGLGAGVAQASPGAGVGTQPAWQAPARFTRPDVASDEGGLWALMDREETRMRRSPFRIRDEGLAKYLKEIACRLGGEHCEDVRTYAMRAPFFNATMAPNGMMQVWSGLLLRTENEAQLAAVIGHELGHYLQRHSVERLRDARSRAAFAQFMGMFGVVGLVGALAAAAGAMAYSRDHERDADRIGVLLMRQAGYDTRAAAQVWGNLLDELKANADADPSRNSVLFATHPSSDERRQTLEDLAAGSPSGNLGAQAYRERIAPMRPMLLEDEIKRGRYAESIVLITRLLRADAGDSLLLHYRGEAHRLRQEVGDTEAALRDFEASLQAAAPQAITHRSMGYLYRALGNAAKSTDHFTRYIALAPQAPDAELIKKEFL